MDKRLRARVFRERLAQGMTARGLTQAALARATGVDRSTLSQLLAPGGKRLPNAQFAAEAAAALGLSADWLLGLSDRPDTPGDLLASVAMTDAPRALVDEAILAWHRAAEGTKIRHVPTGLPDMLKTPAMLRWEAAPSLGRTADQAILAARDRLDAMRAGRSDHEIALPLHELDSFLRGTGLYAGCPATVRREQARALSAQARALYPGLRITLFDARRLYSAPLTVFGTRQAVVYVGQSYLVFRDLARVDAFARHFDGLVRAATVDDRGFADHVEALASSAGL